MGYPRNITRAELYQLIWKEPTTLLAKAFGLSDVGLAKVCKRHDIPRPPRGYWAQRQHGQKPRKTPLPRPDHNPEIEIADRPPRIDVESFMTETDKVEPIDIRVSDTLRGCHELVSAANGELQSAKLDDDGVITSADNRTLDIRTSKASVHRALLIMDALLKECVRREYAVTAGPTITILGHAMKLGLVELVDIKRESDEETDLKKPYEFNHSRFKSIRTLSGRLVLSITQGRGYWANGARSTWRDTDKRPVENCLSKVMLGLIGLAKMAQQHAEEEKRRAEAARLEAARRAEAERQRAERRKQYKAEKARVDALLTQAEDFFRSRRVRELIDAVRAAHESKGPIAADSEIGQWIAWATQQADRLDPLRPKSPSILDEHFEEDNPNPSSAAWRGGGDERPKSYWEQRNWWNR